MIDPSRLASRLLTKPQKQWLKTKIGAAHLAWVHRFRSFNQDGLRDLLQRMGITQGDTILMHSAFAPTNGFKGSPADLIDAVLQLIGPHGTLAMTSMAYTSSTKQYLASKRKFDVRRTPSQMGIVTEVFRRRKSVVRSQSPTHPIIACGERADWLIEGHEKCTYPCGPGSPFEKMLHAGAKMLYYGLPFTHFTFVHTIEHAIRDELPFDLYEPSPIQAHFLDAEGIARSTEVYVFSDAAVARRRVDVITRAMTDEGTAIWSTIGNTQIVLAGMQEALDVASRLAATGVIPFDPDPDSSPDSGPDSGGDAAAGDRIQPTARP